MCKIIQTSLINMFRVPLNRDVMLYVIFLGHTTWLHIISIIYNNVNNLFKKLLGSGDKRQQLQCPRAVHLFLTRHVTSS